MKQELLETEEFYNLMQDYRHAKETDQDKVTRCFGNVKNYIKSNPIDNDGIKALDKSIDIDKLKNQLSELLGFKDEGGTYIFEQHGDNTLHPIKEEFIDNIIICVDSCRKGLDN